VRDPALDLERLPDDHPARLREYQRARAAFEERGRVEAALRVPPERRTEAEWACIQYSPFGTGQGCRH
jgi:hypothetical protein